MEPTEISKKIVNKQYLKMFCIAWLKKFKQKFKIGGRVIIPTSKRSFENEYSNNLEREILIINKINDNSSATYKLKDLLWWWRNYGYILWL